MFFGQKVTFDIYDRRLLKCSNEGSPSTASADFVQRHLPKRRVGFRRFVPPIVRADVALFMRRFWESWLWFAVGGRISQLAALNLADGFEVCVTPIAHANAL